MKDKKIVRLVDLLRRNQDETSDYVIDFLNKNGIVYTKDSYGNVFNFDTKNAPLLSAHMDTVRQESDRVLGKTLSYHNALLATGGILGGDDKCGVSIILEVLKKKKNKVNFCFSRDEEIGLVGITAISKEDKNKIEANCLYCLVLDRAGNGDILCTKNDYGTKEFEDALIKASLEGSFGYLPARGTSSDTAIIRDYISSTNLSVGYYNAHTKGEYILVKDYLNALDYVMYILDNITDKFEKETIEYDYYYKGGKYTYGYGYYDDYYYDYYNTKDESEIKYFYPVEMLDMGLEKKEFLEYAELYDIKIDDDELDYSEYLLELKSYTNEMCEVSNSYDEDASYEEIEEALNKLLDENETNEEIENVKEVEPLPVCGICGDSTGETTYKFELKDVEINLCYDCAKELYELMKTNLKLD